MKIHEFQAKELLRGYGVPMPEGILAESLEDAIEASQKLKTFPQVVKAQVHVGGRGKAGGIGLANNADQLKTHAQSILGMSIKGINVKRVLIEQGVAIDREIYAGIVFDRNRKCPVIMISAAGGIDIEEIAHTEPERIMHLTLEPGLGLCDFQIRKAIFFLNLPRETHKDFKLILQTLERVMIEHDASLVEINPLVVTESKTMLACDAKMNFDDNALELHPGIADLRDENEEEPLETEARHHSLSYVKLDGQIGCLVNGAGLAMATMDLVQYHGGEPANFLDVGGGANPQTIAKALEIVTSDPNVNTILFNIFGGIVRCDRVAEGILAARKSMDSKIPIVMRLVGTNEAKAHEMLKGADLIITATMDEAARKAVELSKRED